MIHRGFLVFAMLTVIVCVSAQVPIPPSSQTQEPPKMYPQETTISINDVVMRYAEQLTVIRIHCQKSYTQTGYDLCYEAFEDEYELKVRVGSLMAKGDDNPRLFESWFRQLNYKHARLFRHEKQMQAILRALKIDP